MHSHSIKVLLDLPELNVCAIQKEKDQVLIEVTPIDATQPCPVCASTQTILVARHINEKYVTSLRLGSECIYFCLQSV